MLMNASYGILDILKNRLKVWTRYILYIQFYVIFMIHPITYSFLYAISNSQILINALKS